MKTFPVMYKIYIYLKKKDSFCLWFFLYLLRVNNIRRGGTLRQIVNNNLPNFIL